MQTRWPPHIVLDSEGVWDEKLKNAAKSSKTNARYQCSRCKIMVDLDIGLCLYFLLAPLQPLTLTFLLQLK